MERVFVERVFGVEARFVEPLFVVARFVPVLRVFAEYVSKVWESQVNFLEAMQDAGRLRCL